MACGEPSAHYVQVVPLPPQPSQTLTVTDPNLPPTTDSVSYNYQRIHPGGVCPSCGHCPTCGRGGYYPTPYVPSYPPYSPYWWTYTGTGGTGGNEPPSRIFC